MDMNTTESFIPRGLFNEVRVNYGDDVCQMCKQFSNLKIKLASIKNRTVFFLQCRRLKVYPYHIKNNIRQIYSLQLEEHPYTRQVAVIMENFQRSVLNLEIKITLWKRKNIQQSIDSLVNVLEALLDEYTWGGVRRFAAQKFEFSFQKIKEINRQKLTRLQNTQNQPITIQECEKFLVNYTRVEIPEKARIILGMGPKHGIIPKNVPIPELIKDVESFIQALSLGENERNVIRSRCTRVIQNFMDRPRAPDPLGIYYHITSKFVRDKPDILVSRSDKGNTTVVMYREEYIQEVSRLLSDDTTYRILNKDPTRKTQENINKFLKTLRDEQMITGSQYKELIRHNSTPPKLYCLRKTHKQVLSFRPIVSCISGPGYNIGSFLHTILSNVLSSSKFKVKDSFSFVEELKNIHVPENYKMMSLDVVSLFTNIPKSLVFQIITKRWRYISCFTVLDENSFIKLVDIVFDSSYFTFNNNFYKQLDGTAMGSPASPDLAELVMLELFEFVAGKLNFDIPIMKICVDDTFLLIPEDHIESTLDLFNSFHEKLQFTVEIENNKSLPFLDVMVIRENDKMITDWYAKPSNSGRCLNFLSNHSFQQKKNVATNLIHRALALSHKTFEKKNIIKITNILLNSNYPPYYIRKAINNYKLEQDRVSLTRNSRNVNRMTNTTNISPEPEVTTKLKYFKLAFFPGLSYRLHNIFKGFGCTTSFYNILDNNKKIFTNTKDKTPITMQSSLVYKIPCQDCDKVYVSQTKQYLKDRIRQDENDSKHLEAENKPALTQHTHREGHRFNFENVSILDKEQHYFRRLLSEMIYIRRNNTVNYREDTNNLSTVYDFVISRITMPNG
ncbi:uncharacterized protein LOC123322305 [Coccinella septempunctata]|uniref:uncharacterized protein LOC123322305 n=1 Tax=Coccinella septempunctata TaxID=41139 RepID=UPI001D090BB6|nr:uncharacterized protein LOC123322305 [Coccinella septempunctata]